MEAIHEEVGQSAEAVPSTVDPGLRAVVRPSGPAGRRLRAGDGCRL